MPSEEIAISLQNVTKTYRVFGHPGDRIKQALTFGRVKFHREFTALKDISLDIKKGEIVGIIGRNGSGKSSLLQLICGILKPTSGRVQVNGRVSALLELGSGFNPEFTGRENVYFQGALMGFNQAEMRARFDEIAAFADIGEFIDQPVRTYSSGMFVRLAFAVAINVDPDILVVDEALAVGDEIFQRKCMGQIDKIAALGHATVILVSHNALQIERFCRQAIFLEKGQVKLQGLSMQVCNAYHAQINAYLLNEIRSESLPKRVRKVESFEILDFFIEDEKGGSLKEVSFQQAIKVLCRFKSENPLQSPTFGIGIHTPDGVFLATENSELVFCDQELQAGTHTLRCVFDASSLLPGVYGLRLGVTTGKFGEVLFYGESLFVFRVASQDMRGGGYGKEGYFGIGSSWSIDSLPPRLNRPETAHGG